jgi:hypothetical protein
MSNGNGNTRSTEAPAAKAVKKPAAKKPAAKKPEGKVAASKGVLQKLAKSGGKVKITGGRNPKVVGKSAVVVRVVETDDNSYGYYPVVKLGDELMKFAPTNVKPA